MIFYKERLIVLFAIQVLPLLYLVSACTPDQYECQGNRGRWTCEPLTAICDRKKDCHWGDDEKTCDVVPELAQYCDKSVSDDGFYKGRETKCTCRTKYEASDRRNLKHRGSAQWRRVSDGTEHGERVTIRSNDTDLDKGYECIGMSGYGDKGTPKLLKTKFAYIDKSMMTMTPKVITLCKNSDDKANKVTCQIPIGKANPAPIFKLTNKESGENLADPGPGNANTAENFQFELTNDIAPSEGGVMNVQCEVTNAQFEHDKDSATEIVTFRRPPPHPPVIHIAGQTFQGESEINIAALPYNFTGELTCNVSGGFPAPTITSLECGVNEGVVTENTGIVRFQNVLVTRSLHKKDCVCKAAHETECYEDNITKVMLKVIFPPGFEPQEGDDDDGDDSPNMLMIGLIIFLSVIIVLLLVVIAVFMVRKKNANNGGSEAERVNLREAKA